MCCSHSWNWMLSGETCPRKWSWDAVTVSVVISSLTLQRWQVWSFPLKNFISAGVYRHLGHRGNMSRALLTLLWTLKKYFFKYKNYIYKSEKAMAPHSSTLAWQIPWMEEPGGLQTMGFLRVRHDWATSLSLFTFMHWRRKWQPTPVFLPGESQGRGSLVGCHLWGCTEWDTTEVT